MTEPHNTEAARVWGRAGESYDFVSFGLADGLAHAVQALWPAPGERILDIATGTGRTARLAAELGARVTGVDIAEPLLVAARDLSGHLGTRLDFLHADAENLPFADASFDGAVSTYGLIFAGRPERAASELGRVVRPGGRAVLMTWADNPSGYIADFFALLGRYSGGPPPEHSPMLWGDPRAVEGLLGENFEVCCELCTTTLYAPDADTLWEKYCKGFGPLDAAAAALDGGELTGFRQGFRDLHTPYETAHGLRVPRQAMMVRARRRHTR